MCSLKIPFTLLHIRKHNSVHVFYYLCLFVQVLFLRNRANNSETATLLTSSGGVILAWSAHGGGLLGKFQASHVEGESVHGMVADSENRLLITGDRMGYIAVSDKTFFQEHWTNLAQFS